MLNGKKGTAFCKEPSVENKEPQIESYGMPVLTATIQVFSHTL